MNTLENRLTTEETAVLFNKIGFFVANTGGGCTAWQYYCRSAKSGVRYGYEILVTDSEDPCIPHPRSEGVTVGLYDRDGEIVIATHESGSRIEIRREFKSIKAAIRFAEMLVEICNVDGEPSRVDLAVLMATDVARPGDDSLPIVVRAPEPGSATRGMIDGEIHRIEFAGGELFASLYQRPETAIAKLDSDHPDAASLAAEIARRANLFPLVVAAVIAQREAINSGINGPPALWAAAERLAVRALAEVRS